jgi:Trypsin
VPPSLRRTFHTFGLALSAVAAVTAHGLESDATAATPRLPSASPEKAAVHPSLAAHHGCRTGTVSRRCRRGGRARAAILGGYTPHASQWPWIARLSMGCGGTLIKPTVIVTAAHCVVGDDGRLSVREDGVTATLGRRTLSDTSTGEVIRTDRILVHDGYVPWAPQTSPSAMHNDVALLRLSRPSGMPTAELGQASDWRNPATAMGWGATSPGVIINGRLHVPPQSDHLLAVDLPLQSDAYCAPRAPSNITYDGRVMLCAGGQGKGTYKGDSGGPLMVGDGAGGGWKLIGVTSYGDPAGNVTTTPSYFAWVSGPTLRPWVVQKADEIVRVPTPDPGPTPAPVMPQPMPGPAPDSTSPTLMTLMMWPSTFRAARRGPSVAASAVGTTIRYRVSEAARVTFKVVRCGGRGCRIRRTIGKVAHDARAGQNRLGFTGRVGGRRLRPGSYRLVARASDGSGNRSIAESVSFRVVR